MRFLLLSLFLIMGFSAIAQVNSYDRFWYFGPTTGFDWISGSPVLVATSSANNIESCQTTNDVNGNLLFYGGDATIYDASHSPMQNGTGMINNNPKQGNACVQDPANPDRYYYIHQSGGGGSAYYSMIDMTLNAPLGGVDPGFKNVVVRSNVSEGLMAIRKANACNEFWVLTHGTGTSDIFVDQLDATGFTLNPAQSIGPTCTGNGGYMAWSATSGKLAQLCGTEDVAIYDFNDVTGVVSNFMNVALPDVPFALEYYSCEFSPDGTKLYVGGGYGQNWLLQVDLSNSNLVTAIDTTTGTGGNTLKLGPDGKIYGQILYTQWTGVINNPNAAGLACNWVPNVINTGITFSDISFPTMMLPSGTGSLPTVALGPDTTICTGQNLLLDAANAGSTYLWSNGDTTQTTTVDSTGQYYVHVTSAGGCVGADTIDVTVGGPNASITGGPTLCEGDSLTLSAPSGYSSYTWSTSETTDSIVVSPTSTTIYSVTVSDGVCSSMDSITITVDLLPTAAILGDTTFCPGGTAMLIASSTGAITWSTTETTDTILVSPSGSTTYTLTATNACGTSVASVTVNPDPGPTADAGADTTISLGNSVQLFGTGGFSYMWSPATGLSCTPCPNPVATPTQTTIYCVTVTDVNGCSNKDTVVVYVDGDIVLFVPNVFSPNGDGLNDVLFAHGTGIEELDFRIYDRWGQKMFETTSLSSGWDGLYNGEPVVQGVYTYAVTAETTLGDFITRTGNITVVR